VDHRGPRADRLGPRLLGPTVGPRVVGPAVGSVVGVGLVGLVGPVAVVSLVGLVGGRLVDQVVRRDRGAEPAVDRVDADDGARAGELLLDEAGDQRHGGREGRPRRDGLEDLVDDAPFGDVVDLHHDAVHGRVSQVVGTHRLEHARAAVGSPVAELHGAERAWSIEQVLHRFEHQGDVIVDDELEDAPADDVLDREPGQRGGGLVDPGDHSE